MLKSIVTLCRAEESRPEVGGVAYKSGVYKIPMVRMSDRTDELANVRVYIVEHAEMYACVQITVSVVE